MSVSDELHAELRRRLIAGHFNPGEKMREEHLASEFEVSRTPVRAAIKKLVSEGLLELVPNSGAFVRQWTENDVEEIFELRLLAEGTAAAWSTRHITDDDIEEMTALNEQIVEASQSNDLKRLDKVQAANHAFHMAMYETCGSARLRVFGSALLEYPNLMGGFYIYSEAEVQESIEQHREILRALKSRNAEWARASVTSHLYAALERFRNLRTDRLAEKATEIA